MKAATDAPHTATLETGAVLRYLGAALILVVGIVHVQQYVDFIGDVPTIAELFVLNGFGAGVIAIMLATRFKVLGALGGIGLSAAALVSLLIASTDSGLFGYQESTLRAPVLISVVAEIAAVILLSAYLLRRRAKAA